MSKEMKVIMERWDRFVLLENETLEKIKDSEVETKNLIQQISKIQDKEQLQNFLNIVSQDEEIMDLVSSFKEMKDIIEKEKLDEGPVDDLLQAKNLAVAKAVTFFDTDLGKKIANYGPTVAAIAFLAFSLYVNKTSGAGVDPSVVQDTLKILLNKGKSSVMDAVGTITGVDMSTGMVSEKRDV